MKKLPIVHLLLLICPLFVVAEKIGPAIVFKNDVRQATTPASATENYDRPDVVVRKPAVAATSTANVRTTTVYGFLDFTTTIDNTVVVFRPSSASTAGASSSSATSVIDESSSSSSSSSSKTDDDRRLHPNIRATKTRQMAATVTANSDGDQARPGRTRIAGPAIVMLGRADSGEVPAIAPTPALRRGIASSNKQSLTSAASSSQSGRRLVNSSSLSEKRRRFLALARRHRPTIKPKADVDVAVDRLSESSDQEMAESIERTPNKVKRMYQAISPMPNYANSSASAAGSAGGRILIRKLQRRLGGSTRSDKNRQALAFRRPSSKLNLLTGPGANPDEEFDDKEADPDQDQRTFLIKNGRPLELASSFDSTTSGGLAASGAASGLDVTEYHELYHDVTEYLGTDSKATAVLRSSLASHTPDDNDRSPGVDQTVELTLDKMTTPALHDVDPALLKSSVHLGPTVPLQLSIVTSTYSTTETRLRTSLLPVYDGKSTTFYTLTHSFVVTKTVSTFQTVPPEEYMHYLIPGKNNNNDNDDKHDDGDHHDDRDSLDATSNDVLESTDGRPTQASVLQRKVDDQDNEEDDDDDGDNDEAIADSSDDLLDKASSSHADVAADDEKKSGDVANPAASPALLPGAIGQQPGAVNPALLGNLPFLNLLGPAAALGLNPYFPYGLGIPQVLTTSRPVFSTDVIYTSKLVPIIDGLTTAYRTLQEAASTVTRTSYETYVTTTAGAAPGNVGGLMGGHPGLGAPGGGGGGVSIITQPHTFVTTETQVETQVFKLMYDGYKTSYRTVSSSQLITRTVTTHTTTTVPVYNTMQLPFFG